MVRGGRPLKNDHASRILATVFITAGEISFTATSGISAMSPTKRANSLCEIFPSLFASKYVSPIFPFSIARRCPRATSLTSTALIPPSK